MLETLFIIFILFLICPKRPIDDSNKSTFPSDAVVKWFEEDRKQSEVSTK